MGLKAEIPIDILQEMILALSTVTEVGRLYYTPKGIYGIVTDSKRAMKVHTALRAKAILNYEADDGDMLFLIEDVQTQINIAKNYMVDTIGIEYDGKNIINFNMDGVVRKVMCADPKYGEDIAFNPPKKWDAVATIDSLIFGIFLRNAIMVSDIVTFSATNKGLVFVTNDVNATVSLVLKKENKKMLPKLKVGKNAKSFYALDYLTVGSVPICRDDYVYLAFNDKGQLLLSSNFANKNGMTDCWLAPKGVTATVEEQSKEQP